MRLDEARQDVGRRPLLAVLLKHQMLLLEITLACFSVPINIEIVDEREEEIEANKMKKGYISLRCLEVGQNNKNNTQKDIPIHSRIHPHLSIHLAPTTSNPRVLCSFTNILYLFCCCCFFVCFRKKKTRRRWRRKGRVKRAVSRNNQS